jgi:hypothetical protein
VLLVSNCLVNLSVLDERGGLGSLRRQLRELIPAMLLAYLPTLAALLAIGILAGLTGQHVWYFTSDPFVLGHLPFYAGILSNVGMLLWSSAAAICFFTCMVVNKDVQRVQWKRFLLGSGFPTSVLLLDDLFQIHRVFFLEYANLTAVSVYFIYGCFTLMYVGHFRRQILETEFVLLAFALSFFVLAIVFDFLPLPPRGRTAFSDALKLFGIVSWFAYFSRTCCAVLTSRHRADK